MESANQLDSLKTRFGRARMEGSRRFGVKKVLVRPMPLTRIMSGTTQFLVLILAGVLLLYEGWYKILAVGFAC
jgi:hypothetical protein